MGRSGLALKCLARRGSKVLCSDLRRRSGVDNEEDHPERLFCQTVDGPGVERGPDPSVAVVALHQPGDGLPGRPPLFLVGEDVDLGGAPPSQLADRRDHRVMQDLAAPAGVDQAGYEVAADEVVRRPAVTDPDPVTDPQRLEPFVVADRVAIVFDQVLGDRQAPPGAGQ